ncbi:MAG TPA: sulfite exporter TauE/SafE family protein [Burkholderiales bacterium]|nr:sulfite exporter TauE/SafE family protein [Burkholderiales bacterium]
MTAFLDLGAPVLAACAAAILAGGLVKGVVGIGLPLVALPVMVNFIPVPKAIALLILSSFATSVWQSVDGGEFASSARRFWPLLAGIAVGVAISVKALTTFDIKALYLILGAIVTVFASVLHRRMVFSVAPRAERWVAPLTGVVAGLMGGLSMLFGPIYAMYLSGLRLGREMFVAAISLANVWATVVLAAAMAKYDLLGGADLMASLLALIPSSLGVLLGTKLRRHINETVFRKMLAVVLFLIGLNLIRRAVL